MSCLPLVGDTSFELIRAVLCGAIALSDQQFDAAYSGLKFFLAGKQADVWLEARYMLLMTCVEAMDGKNTRQLRRETTSALLAVSGDAATLFNCMRNQLVHGQGGYRKAFAAFLKDDLKGRELVLESELQGCIDQEGSLDFVQLWLRLCERLDAFWCAYLRVPIALVAQRHSSPGCPVMGPVELEKLDGLVNQVVEEGAQSGESKQIKELNAAIARLKTDKTKLEQCLKLQGQRLQANKAGLEK